MARLAYGDLELKVNIIEANTGLGVGAQTSTLKHPFLYALEFENGTGDGDIDRVHSDSFSIAAPTDIDVRGGLTSDLTGSATNFVDVSLIIVKNTTAAGGGNVLVGGDANAITGFGAAGVTPIPPGGCVMWSFPSGIATTNLTADILQLDTSSGTVTGEYIIAGRSA